MNRVVRGLKSILTMIVGNLLNRFKPDGSRRRNPYFFQLVSLLVLFSAASPSHLLAQCSISSAQICVGADDQATIWINGNILNAGAAVPGVQYGNAVPCITVPAADLVLG